MIETGQQALHRRLFLGGALAAGAVLAAPGAALAQAAVDTATEAVRRLMVRSTQDALTRLSQPNGFLTSTVARFGLPVLFGRRGQEQPGPLTQPQFREQLQQRLNIIAEAGALGAAPAVAEAARKAPITNALAILRGAPTAATSALRLEMGSGLVNALRGPLEQALVAAQDVVVGQALAALPGVTLADVAHAVALSADNGIWYEIGAAEADIRANPQATGDTVLISALASARPPVPAPSTTPAPGL
jgi:hypothetical protein